MKYCSALAVLLFSAALAAQEAVLPPQEEAPFRIVIETVPEEEEESPVVPQTVETPSLEEASVSPDPNTPVVETQAEEVYEEVEPNCGHVLSPPAGYSKEVLMLQIFLDRHNFSCGVIDGVWGDGSRDAMRAWQRSVGRRQTQWVDVPLYAQIAQMEEAILRYVISAEDVALVTGALPPTWAERAKLSLMGYETLGACIAEKFHTSERTLRRLNPGIINWPDDLTEGAVVMVPNVRMAALEKPETVVIALDDCVLAGFDARGVIRLRFPCSIARNRAHLPKTGGVKIKNMAPAPNYTYDPANYGQDPSIGKMVVPAGPRNPVGSRWIGLSLPGYGIHGTPRPNTVGRPESRGCFRLTNWNAEKLFELVRPGMQVEIVKSLAAYQPPKALSAPESDREKPAPAAAAEPKQTAATPAVSGESAPAPAAAPLPVTDADEFAELEAELEAAAEEIAEEASESGEAL